MVWQVPSVRSMRLPPYGTGRVLPELEEYHGLLPGPLHRVSWYLPDSFT
jgi:hypothetical protein